MSSNLGLSGAASNGIITTACPGGEVTGDVMRRCRLRWHRHVERKDDAAYVKACTRLVMKGKALVGRLRKT